MRHLFTPTIALLLCTSLFLIACGESATDEPLPEGTTPNEPERSEIEAPEKPGGETDTPQPPVVPPVVEEKPKYPPLPLPTPPEGEAERSSASGLSYVLPEGWTAVLPDSPNAMRRVTLVPPGHFEKAELAVFRFGGSVGGFAMNVNRWAGQVGLPSIPGLTTAASSDFEKFKIDGINATWIPLMNPDTNLAILAVWVPIGEDPENPDFTWTLKLTCKADQVQALAPAVRAWCESIKFED